ncbi:uncharacterized protein [Nicotiana tomentosiformis]|uniref:uncharacterized protein n=1 Tax=Nicotiana tomentosiformis TaxID=4098 RepID=UPI00388C3DE3
MIKKTANSQQHDSKNAEIRRSEVSKTPELEGDVEKHLKTHNSLLNTVAGSSTASSTSAKKKEEIKPKYTNINMNNLFSKPFTQKNIQNTQNKIFLLPQTNTYKESLNQTKKTYNHITRTYIDNIYKIQNFLNKNPRSQTTQNQNEDYITHYLTGYNKLIALPNTNAKLVATCYNYGLLDTVYTQTGQEIATIPELHRAFMQYRRITKGTLFYIRFYSATAEILYEEIKPIIQVIKIGLTRKMLIPERIEEQEEIEKINIPDFYANKRIIGISTILNELANNYLNQNITCQDKATQTEPDNTMENLFLAMTTLCKKVESMDEEIQMIKKTANSQQHDSKNVEIRRSEVSKTPELEGDVEKHLKTHNSLLNTVAGSSTASITNIQTIYAQNAKEKITLFQTLQLGIQISLFSPLFSLIYSKIKYRKAMDQQEDMKAMDQQEDIKNLQKQITCQDKATQTEPDNTMENLFLAMTTLCKKVENMDEEIQMIKKTANSQQHDSKNAEIRRSEVSKTPELEVTNIQTIYAQNAKEKITLFQTYNWNNQEEDY